MKTPTYTIEPMTKCLRTALAHVRSARQFRPRECLQAKAQLLNTYFEQSNLDTAVVGVSGGIDSAVTLGILSAATKQPGSPIKRIIAAPMPVFTDAGSTNQESARAKGRTVVEAFGAELIELDLSPSFAVMRDAVKSASGIAGDAWADGQLVSYIRTPALYYLATLLTASGNRAAVCGTTNRDEGAYLGFFGKASDGMVDIQVISDLHKSEVYALANILNVPKDTVAAAPHGDVFDGKTHLEMIGTPYDFVELYTVWLGLSDGEKSGIQKSWTSDSHSQFEEWARRIEGMHNSNLHKYLGGSPSIHLDVYERGTPGGWTCGGKIPTERGAERNLVNEFAFSDTAILTLQGSSAAPVEKQPLADLSDTAMVLDRILTTEQCDVLMDEISGAARVAVGQNGMLKDFDAKKSSVGSYRATVFSPELATRLWESVRAEIPLLRIGNELSATETAPGEVWRAVGINPAMRYIWYERGGYLVPHYDGAYSYPQGSQRTLMSVVIYLTDFDESSGGATRFIRDDQRNMPRSERNRADWTSAPDESAIVACVTGKKGRVLIFDHELLHDGQAWEPGTANTPKVIIRTDIIFQRCGTGERRGSPKQLHIGGSATNWRRNALEQGMLSDPFYRHTLAATGSATEVIRAGYFSENRNTNAPEASPAMLLSTPLYKIQERLSGLCGEKHVPKRLVVLVTTGGFAPIHSGHLAMMESAKRCAEECGDVVLGGYLCPDHDEYVQAKDSRSPRAEERLHYCRLAVASSGWLMVDPWAALFQSHPVNFTTIIERLSHYLARMLAALGSIQVVYVCGEDNADLANAFLGRDGCIVVPRAVRTSSETTASGIAPLREKLHGNPRVVLALSAPLGFSSRKIRAGDCAALPAAVRPAWLQQASSLNRRNNKRETVTLFLRDDGLWSLIPLLQNRQRRDVVTAYTKFREGLVQVIRDAFNRAGMPVDITLLDLAEQRRKARSIRKHEITISLDPCVSGDYNIGTSRVFELNDSTRQSAVTARPGFPPLSLQLEEMPEGEFTILEDDIATGKSMQSFINGLPAGRTVRRIVTLSPTILNDTRATGDVCDIGDVRDFIVGSREGGLVVRLPDGNLARAPYAWPYVNLHDRMSIPLASEARFSGRIWELNRILFESIVPAVTVQECSEAFQRLCACIGLPSGAPLTELCDWHLERSVPRSTRTGNMMTAA